MRHVRPAVAVLLFSVLLVAGSPAAASCTGPTIGYSPLVVAPGATVTVTARGFGDNCHDTGSPPPWEGVLGTPLTDIEIHINQGPGSWLVGRGAADADYAFDAEVVVPEVLRPGEAALTVRIREGVVHGLTDQPLTITDGPPEDHGTEGIVTFGPAPAPPTTASSIASAASAEPAGDGRDEAGWLVVGVAVGAIGLIALAWTGWRRRPDRSMRRPR